MIIVLIALFAALVANAASRDTNVCVVRVLAVNYDPILREHGNVRLSRHMKWNDPRPMTTNLMRYLRECSGGYADYRLVDFIDVDAWPQKRDGFRYDERSFLEMKESAQTRWRQLRRHLQGTGFAEADWRRKHF